MITLGTSLSFDGQCEQAFKFYEKALGGKIAVMMTWGDSPMGKDAPREWDKKIIHSTFTLGDRSFIGSDAPPGRYEKPQGFQVLLDMTEPAEAERVFKSLSEKGTIQMHIAQTFWAVRFGMVVDQFGIPWMINCGKPS